MINLEYYSPQYLERKLDQILAKRKKGINLLIRQELIRDAPELLKNLNIRINTVLYGECGGVISRYKIKYHFDQSLLIIKIDEDMQVNLSLIQDGVIVLEKGFFEKDIKIFRDDVNPIIISYLMNKSWYNMIKNLDKNESVL